MVTYQGMSKSINTLADDFTVQIIDRRRPLIARPAASRLEPQQTTNAQDQCQKESGR